MTDDRPTCPTHGDRAITRDAGQGGSGPFGPWYCLRCKNTARADFDAGLAVMDGEQDRRRT